MDFKAQFIALLTVLGMSEWAGKLEASSDKNVNITAEELSEIKGKVEKFKSDTETANQNAKDAIEAQEKAENNLKAANESKEKAEGELKEANDRIAALEEENTALKGEAGALPTNAGGDGGKGDGKKEEYPEYVNMESAHMQDLLAVDKTFNTK